MPSSSSSLRRRSFALGLLLLLVALIGSGCSAAATPSPAATAAAPSVTGAWVRPPQGAGLPAAGYMVIKSGGQADALLSITSSAAGSVELHETTTMSGMTGMQPISRLDIPAGGSVELKPGSYHLMLMSVKALTVGDSVELVLTFEKAGRVTVKAEVKNG